MANQEQLAILKRGVKEWNEWRREHLDDEIDLSASYLIEANLSEAELSLANLQVADLGRAVLSRAILYRTNLRGANLPSADLSGTHLIATDLSRATLSGANLTSAKLRSAQLDSTVLSRACLRWADLYGANLNDADLRCADLSFANLNQTILTNTRLEGCELGLTVFGSVDLSTVKGLETAIHLGPSTIGIDTIYKSKGKIPETFLRGAGVPENFITYMRSLTGAAFEFYSCFISYSSKDQEFADRLRADLQSKGVRVWFFSEDAKWGETVWGEIDRSIKIYDKLVVLLSENSLQSGPVLREIDRALNREDKEAKNILFPIRIDEYVFQKWEHERKADVTRKVIGDFTKWKEHDAYQKAFERLLRDLQGKVG